MKNKKNKKEVSFREGFIGRDFKSSKEALAFKTKRVSKASLLLNYVSPLITKGSKRIEVDFKKLFSENGSNSELIKKSKPSILNSTYGDSRFPKYVLRLTDSLKKYRVEDTVIRPTTNDNGKGRVENALKSFSLVKVS